MNEEQQPLLQPTQSIGRSFNEALRSRNQKGRRRLRQFLSSRLGHISVLALVTVDVACIFADLVIQTFKCGKQDDPPKLDAALEALGIVSLVISCLFVAELLASVWAFGFSYFRSKFHCFDAIVILVAFVVDVLLRGVLEEVASIVVVLRLWRVFKIVEELSGAAEDQMDVLREKIKELETENSELRDKLDQSRQQTS